ncbi:hypothetical protein ACGFMK_35035 [Amycolatopsis sp. NPDC049252]|uniref:hypothetical protein n=1 Tax=Amycolatopsis sp. NPDC049252 TaxID=3363933 RepID=UPI00371CE69F
MTDAVIYIDPLMIHPVIDGVWHHARLVGIPDPGEAITMLCGVTGVAAFLPLGQRRHRTIPRQCERCDALVRQQRGIPLWQQRIRRS